MADADSQALEASETLEDMVRSMRAIGASSEKLTQVVDVINEIAFQINMLALNATPVAADAPQNAPEAAH
jgi:methyl-accepting chemotaxis protein